MSTILVVIEMRYQLRWTSNTDWNLSEFPPRKSAIEICRYLFKYLFGANNQQDTIL